ncbi:sulfotransferase [Egicoccus sp. AB-alg2]|uniref:sulfotransferase family protein n=1 Tax=Egicoccus sp. AB-alg2 TaxID=3242693 RepID=UPI00359ED1E6
MSGPVFLAGLADTGKTPLRLMLSAHPDFVMVRGTRLWERFDGRFGDLTDPGNLERLLAALLADDAVARLRPDPAGLRRAVATDGASYATVLRAVHDQHARSNGRRRWGEQFGMADVAAPRLFEQLPDARIVHLVRDPVSHCRVVAGRGRRRLGAVGRTTARWLRSAQAAIDNVRRFEGRYLVVRFEALRDDRETTLRRVCAFLDAPFAPAMLAVGADGGLRKPEAGPATGSAEARLVTLFAARYLDTLGYPRSQQEV